ncbi:MULTISPECIES: hypothetical protein [Achromobacter]|uniref:Porin n=1 Tax=Achromobacter spanius TaxID=217203 RepID=A0ABY8GLV8_9BURK|nr:MULTISPECIES: hypothetical protein [Achromobacter]WAI84943.1 hypothetical protein N8Z00_07665 [Achromobacter spanius]WEX95025.1 hypothetical protein N3Z32_02255 [Achromobacter sp. SS2-2022]WFP05805.1 hypothetical protein P8T11_15825 [Achromobacter spanius]
MFATFKKIALGALLATSLAASVMPLTAQAFWGRQVCGDGGGDSALVGAAGLIGLSG